MCLTPHFRKELNVFVPCGYCPLCRARRVSGWSFRLMQQLKVADSAYFITLTYDDNSIPIEKTGYMGLRKRDLQLFFKRLRKSHVEYERDLRDIGRMRSDYESKSIKYFAVGEYGERSMRPHYHLILFNARIQLIQDAWALLDKKTGEIRHFGEIHYGDERGVCEQSIGYCMKYISKPAKIPMHRNDDREREFSLKSKGLGVNYLTDEMLQWHLADIARMYCNIEGGKKISMPRYYKDKIYSDQQRKEAADICVKKMHEKEMHAFLHSKDPVKDWYNRRIAIKEAIKNVQIVERHQNSKL